MLIDIQNIYTICLKSQDIDDQQDIMIYIAYFWGGGLNVTHKQTLTHSQKRKQRLRTNFSGRGICSIRGFISYAPLFLAHLVGFKVALCLQMGSV